MTKSINELRPYPVLKRLTRSYGTWFRIENPVTPGLPDALYISRKGEHRWFEFKALRWSSKENVWKLTNLRPGQKARIHQLLNNQVKVFFVLSCGKDWHIIRAALVLGKISFRSIDFINMSLHWQTACGALPVDAEHVSE